MNARDGNRRGNVPGGPHPDLPGESHLEYLLTAYIFGDISEAGRREVEEHLASCARCRGERESLVTTLATLKEVVGPGPAAAEGYSFEARRLERVLAARRERGWMGRLGTKRPYVLSAAAALLIVSALCLLPLTYQAKYKSYARFAVESPGSAAVSSAPAEARGQVEWGDKGVPMEIAALPEAQTYSLAVTDRAVAGGTGARNFQVLGDAKPPGSDAFAPVQLRLEEEAVTRATALNGAPLTLNGNDQVQGLVAAFNPDAGESAAVTHAAGAEPAQQAAQEGQMLLEVVTTNTTSAAAEAPAGPPATPPPAPAVPPAATPTPAAVASAPAAPPMAREPVVSTPRIWEVDASRGTLVAQKSETAAPVDQNASIQGQPLIARQEYRDLSQSPAREIGGSRRARRAGEPEARAAASAKPPGVARNAAVESTYEPGQNIADVAKYSDAEPARRQERDSIRRDTGVAGPAKGLGQEPQARAADSDAPALALHQQAGKDRWAGRAGNVLDNFDSGAVQAANGRQVAARGKAPDAGGELQNSRKLQGPQDRAEKLAEGAVPADTSMVTVESRFLDIQDNFLEEIGVKPGDVYAAKDVPAFGAGAAPGSSEKQLKAKEEKAPETERFFRGDCNLSELTDGDFQEIEKQLQQGWQFGTANAWARINERQPKDAYQIGGIVREPKVFEEDLLGIPNITRLPGEDGVMNTPDDRVVVFGGGKDHGAQGGKPASLTAEIVPNPDGDGTPLGAGFEYLSPSGTSALGKTTGTGKGRRLGDILALERLLRAFKHYKTLDPSLTLETFSAKEIPVPPPTVGDEGLGQEGFRKRYGVNPFVDTQRDHFSTFGMDVDKASYTLARNTLSAGKMPDPKTIRVEEFINYFPDEAPADPEHVFSVFSEGGPSPFGEGLELLKISVKARDLHPGERKDAVLTFAVDTSGSMATPAQLKSGETSAETRLKLVRASLGALVKALGPDDRVGIVAYSSQPYLVLPHTPARESHRILGAIESLAPRGATNVEAGLDLAYRVADEVFQPKAVNRVILCSDGVANAGARGPEEILKKVRVFAGRGIYLSCVGVGMGRYNDSLLETLANKGNGNYAYVDSAAEAEKIFRETLPSTLQVLAQDAKIQVDFNAAVVSHYRLLGYENRDIADKDFRNDKVDAGEVGPGSTVTVLYEIRRKASAAGDLGRIYLRYRDTGTGRVDEANYPLSPGVLATRLADTSDAFRFTACVAELAELLRSSYWSRDGSYGNLLWMLYTVSPEFRARPQWREVEQLVRRALELESRRLASEASPL